MTRLGFFAALTVMAAVILGCGPAKDLPDAIPKTTQLTEKRILVPKQSEPAAKELVVKAVNAYTGNKPELVEKGKYARLTTKGKILLPNANIPVDANRRTTFAWPDRVHDVQECPGGQLPIIDLRLHRPHLWTSQRADDPTGQNEKNRAADYTGQYWMAMMLPLLDPKAVVFDLKEESVYIEENKSITCQTLKLSLGDYPLFLVCFDKKSLALAAVEYRTTELGIPILRTMFFKNHKPGPEGLNLPTRLVLVWNGQTAEDWEIEKWELPTTIGDEEFAIPKQ